MAHAPLHPGPLTASTITATLSAFRYGSGDLTTRLGHGELWRATLTPDGPATLHLRWGRDATIDAEAWGPGAGWVLAQVPAMTGQHDEGHRFTDAHPVVAAAQRHSPDLRLGASGALYHELLPVVLAQRVTTGEALRQWHLLVRRLGDPAPGPAVGLRLPPAPHVLAARPAWWFHPLGIEAKRADALREVARHPQRLWEWSTLPPAMAASKLALLRGVGPWTVGAVLGSAFGDPDAVPVGDYHLKHLVVHAFTGRPRGTDEEMLELLAPYAGQRGRVVRLLQLAGHRPPVFGPRQRVLPTDRW